MPVLDKGEKPIKEMLKGLTKDNYLKTKSA
jgi:hypothetical protein